MKRNVNKMCDKVRSNKIVRDRNNLKKNDHH